MQSYANRMNINDVQHSKYIAAGLANKAIVQTCHVQM